MRATFLAAFAAIGTFAKPITETAHQPTSRRLQEPCALVAAQGGQRVDAATALACLRSVPLDTKRNPDLVRAMRTGLEFQTTLAYLKNPPPGALYPAVDIVAGLEDIAQRLNSSYTNEYDFQFDIHALSQAGYDFHFKLNVDITAAFSWQRAEYLLSLSKDGVSLPDIYLNTDLPALTGNRSHGYNPSAIAKINGMDVETWINNNAGLNPWGHDPDVNYNYVMLNVARRLNGDDDALGTFHSTTRPQDGNTTVLFTNGTQKAILTYATSAWNWTGVVDGQTFFEKFCNGGGLAAQSVGDGPSNGDSESNSTTSSVPATTTAVSNTTYVAFTPLLVTPVPEPTSTGVLNRPVSFVRASDGSVSGYFPNDQNDLAVLAMPTFDPKYPLEFQNTVRIFLATAQAYNKTRLIVDIRGNDGGKIFLGYDTFRQLFPSIDPYGATQMRSHPLYRDLVAVFTDYYNATGSVENDAGAPFNVLNLLDSNGMSFATAKDFYNPQLVHGDNFTALGRANLSITASTSPVSVYGYGLNTLPITQVFKAENIVLLSDGFCGSTCAIFAEFMKTQAVGVKSIAVGGRRQNGPMQAVGGSKGAQVLALKAIGDWARDALSWASPIMRVSLTNDLTSAAPGWHNLANRTDSMRFNSKNNIRKGDTSLTPLQYVYEAADCRFFYTADMITRQPLVWRRAADIRWSGATCVPGSAGHPSSFSGLDYINSYPPVGANYTFGAPDQVYPSGVANPASTLKPSGAQSIAASTGSSVMDTRTTYSASATPTSLVSSTATPSATTTTTSSATATFTGAADRQSIGVVTVVVGLLLTCLA